MIRVRQPALQLLRSPFSGDHLGFADPNADTASGSASRWIRLFPLTRNWRTIGASYILWTLFLLYGHWTSGQTVTIWLWASALTIPLTHIGALAFVAPLPWILPRRLPSPWNYILGFVISVVTCELVSALLPVIDAWILSQDRVSFSLARIVRLYVSLVGPTMMVVGGLVAARARSEELRKASEAEALIAKNRLLQSQIHPHVLFNALNGLAELVHKDPKAAESAIRHLSDLLRRILMASEHVLLPLKEERMIIEDYLALESIRLGGRLKVTWDWDNALDPIELPPLLIQPMVENAIKHGIAPSIAGGEVIIRVRSQAGALLLEVWNSGEPLRINHGKKGIGVDNLNSRLSLHFGSRAKFSIGSSEQGTQACIRLEAFPVECTYESTEGPGCR